MYLLQGHCGQHRRLVLTHFSRRYDMMMVNDPRGVAPEEERNPDALDEEFDSNNVQSLLQEVWWWCGCRGGGADNVGTQARQAFGQDQVLAAYDLYTLPVARNDPQITS